MCCAGCSWCRLRGPPQPVTTFLPKFTAPFYLTVQFLFALSTSCAHAGQVKKGHAEKCSISPRPGAEPERFGAELGGREEPSTSLHLGEQPWKVMGAPPAGFQQLHRQSKALPSARGLCSAVISATLKTHNQKVSGTRTKPLVISRPFWSPGNLHVSINSSNGLSRRNERKLMLNSMHGLVPRQNTMSTFLLLF